MDNTINDMPEQPNDDEQPTNSVWAVPLEFGAERGSILEQSEAELSDTLLLVSAHYKMLMREGLPVELVYALTRDFHAQGANGFWDR